MVLMMTGIATDDAVAAVAASIARNFSTALGCPGSDHSTMPADLERDLAYHPLNARTMRQKFESHKPHDHNLRDPRMIGEEIEPLMRLLNWLGSKGPRTAGPPFRVWNAAVVAGPKPKYSGQAP